MSGSGDPRDLLSPRERDVYDLIVEGRANKAIAAELHLSHATVKSHVSRILAKTGSRSRAEVIVSRSHPVTAPLTHAGPSVAVRMRWPVLPAIAVLVAASAAALTLTLTNGLTGWTLVVLTALLAAAAWAVAAGRRAAGFAVVASVVVIACAVSPQRGGNLEPVELAFALDPPSAVLAALAVVLLFAGLWSRWDRARRRAATTDAAVTRPVSRRGVVQQGVPRRRPAP
jgi:DNA-binding CsgD family transcriptional regulator